MGDMFITHRNKGMRTRTKIIIKIEIDILQKKTHFFYSEVFKKSLSDASTR